MPAESPERPTARADFRPVRPVRAYQRVAEQIEERILGGSLPPGSRLPGERELMRQFDVGRSTIREALRVLQSSGLIRSRPGDPQGAEVLGVSPDTLSHALGRLARSHLSGLGELIQFRMLLDAESYRLAARLHSADDLRRLTGLVDEMAQLAPGDPRGFSAADGEFHRVVAEASGNALLALCARAVHDAVVEAIESKLVRAEDAGEAADAMRRSVAHHRQILAALGARDGARAARLGRQALHDHYAPHVPPQDRPRLRAALEEEPESPAG
ncbi:FadR/GntR family transcriptional regulator [Streptomyces diacarni]|uniref:FadR/GntR family transcriptional regulator n=1 Tax=Streptomyces diacarni TaxID=2800381 RepID=UPI0033CEC37F